MIFGHKIKILYVFSCCFVKVYVSSVNMSMSVILANFPQRIDVMFELPEVMVLEEHIRCKFPENCK